MTPELHSRIEQAADQLRRGGIVAYPTETFYGLGALASSLDALERLARAKLRPEGKPLPVLAADRAMAAEVVAHFEPLAERLAAHFWPGPLTLVLPAAASLAHALTAGSDTIGIRVPGSEVARELSRRAGGCIVSTSANLSGGAPATTSAALDPVLVAQLDGVLDGGPTPGGLASTVLAVRDGQLTLLRPGAIAWEALLPFAAPAGTLQGRGG